MTPDYVPDLQFIPNSTASHGPVKNRVQMRQQAKEALASLVPHGVRYSDLVMEGVDPTLLQQLYHEIGINVAPQPTPVTNIAQTSPGDTSQPSSGVPHVQGSEPPALHRGSGAVSTTQLTISPELSSSQPPSRLPNAPVGSVSHNSNSVADPAALTRESPAPAKAPDAAMERKDRIAQMLAARIGKALANASQPVQGLTTQASPSSASPANAGAPKSLPTSTAPTASHVTLQPTKSAKSKAQTDLVRQKMEALRREAVAKSQSSPQGHTTAPQKPTIMTDPAIAVSKELQPSAVASRQIPIDVTSESRPIRQARSGSSSTPTSALAPPQEFGMRIPGLFMTSADIQDLKKQASKAPTPQTQASEPSSTKGDQDLTFMDQPANRRSHSTSAQRFLTELNLESLSRESSRSRTGQKRPLAVDSFDDQTPPNKKRSGGRFSDDLAESIVSEKEDGEASEGIGMDIDEESQPSPVVEKAPTLPTTTPAEFIPPTAITAANKSAPVSTTAKEAEKEETWRIKNLEIEAMHKRIADMEKRRLEKQEKHSASQLQSPRASLPSSPIPPAPRPGSADPLVGATLVPFRRSLPAEVEADASLEEKPQTPISAVSSGPTADALARMEELRQKILRRKAQKSAPPVGADEELRATRQRLAETQAKLAQMELERERREAEIREDRRREVEIREEAIKLEEQLRLGMSSRERDLAPKFDNVATKPQVSIPQALSSGLTQAGTQSEPNTRIEVGMPEAYENASLTQLQPVSPSRHENSLLDEQRPQSNEDVDASRTETTPGSFEQEKQSLESEKSFATGAEDATAAEMPRSREPSLMHDENDDFGYDIASAQDARGPSRFEEGDASLPENEASVSMSDSESDAHEPAEDFDQSQAMDDSDDYDPENSLVLPEAMDTIGDMEDDDYEPAETITPIDIDHQSQLHISNDPQQGLQISDASKMEEEDPSPPLEASSNPPPTDDSEGGLQLTETNTLTKVQDYAAAVNGGTEDDLVLLDNTPASTHFTPYRSPLTSLKNFRFDSRFVDLVAGGYKSMTYSNKIDPRRPLCPTELQDGICNDSTCEEQHLQDATLKGM